MSTCKLRTAACILRVHYDSRHRTISQELMCLPEGVRIPLNYNVIDFTQRICLDEKRVCTHCMSTRVHVSSTYVRWWLNRTKPITHVISLAGVVRIPFNYNVIDITHLIRLDESWVYTYCMSTSVQRTSACALRSYHVRSMMADTDLSQELMCLTERGV